MARYTTHLQRLVLALLAALAASTGLAQPAAAEYSKENVDMWDRDAGDGLCDYVLRYRIKHNVSPRSNVAAMRFIHPSGKSKVIAVSSKKYSAGGQPPNAIQGHAERRLIEIAKKAGFDLKRITEMCSELEPCDLPGRHCERFLARELPNVRVYYMLPYGDEQAERARSVRRLGRLVRRMYCSLNATARILNPPGRATLGTLPRDLARPPGSDRPGVDFSTMELGYLADPGDSDRDGPAYAFQARPGPPEGGDPALGLLNAQQTSDAFFVWLALPPESFWVNLAIEEPGRVIDERFGRTDAGRIVLESDLMLKRLVVQTPAASSPAGKTFQAALAALYAADRPGHQICWDYSVAMKPHTATVYETDRELYILDAPLRVEPFTLPSDDECPRGSAAFEARKLELYRQLIIPTVQHVVDTHPAFGALRRVYRARIAADWFRRQAARRPSALSRLVNSSFIDPWVLRTDWTPQSVWTTYSNEYHAGGGANWSTISVRGVDPAEFQARWPELRARVQQSLDRVSVDAQGQTWIGARGRPGTQLTRRISRC